MRRDSQKVALISMKWAVYALAYMAEGNTEDALLCRDEALEWAELAVQMRNAVTPVPRRGPEMMN